MHRLTALNAALDITKLRIQAGTYKTDTISEMLKDINELVDGLEKVRDEPNTGRSDFSRPR
ncbi:MAG TPA: hypothetical protein VK976_01495 [Verrucomicrobiae bacterium]|jgi:hypothetical protein|nr:hypothetical protein [Verrucomicrobiae bacterium]